MVDYSINSNFDIHFTEWDDFATVDGLEEFQQDVVIQLHDNLNNILNRREQSGTAEEQIKLEVSRVARQFGVIDSIYSIQVEPSIGEKASYQVTVNYITGDSFSEQF